MVVIWTITGQFWENVATLHALWGSRTTRTASGMGGWSGYQLAAPTRCRRTSSSQSKTMCTGRSKPYWAIASRKKGTVCLRARKRAIITWVKRWPYKSKRRRILRLWRGKRWRWSRNLLKSMRGLVSAGKNLERIKFRSLKNRLI